jgi:beta-lactamase regulating signal transducer with metallopeptidase domain/uncharacterized protein YjbI with pentapeptide repeats
MKIFGMNLQDMNDFFGFDFSATLCLTLAHSLWQIALLAYMAKVFVGISCRKDAQWGYGVYVWTLILSLLAIPATFLFFSETSFQVASLVVEFTENPIAEPLEFAKPDAIAPPQIEVGIAPLPEPKNVDAFFANSFGIADWAPKVITLYITGVFIMLVRLGFAFLSTQYLARHGEPITVGPVVEAVNRLIHAWQMRVRPVITHAHDIVVPQVVGLLKPTILIPTSALSGLTPTELEMILTHELAHVRRLDMWVNLLQRLAEAVLFFNPALWYLSRQISTYREYCCDELTCGGPDETSVNRLQYAQALLRVVELSSQRIPHGQLASLAATGSRPSELRRRVARLFGEPLREPVGISRGGLMIVITGMVLLFAVPVGWQNAAEIISETESVIKEPTVDAPPIDPAELKYEIVAIGTHEAEPQAWWNKAGQPLSEVPFQWYDTDRKLPEGTTWRRVVIRVSGLPENHEHGDMTWRLPDARYYWGAYVKPTDPYDPHKYYARYFQWNGKDTFDLKMGLAEGEWRTVSKGTMSGGPRREEIVISDPIDSEDGLTVFVSHNVTDRPYRILAIDRKGKAHRSTRGGGTSINNIVQSQGQFPDLDEDDVDHFEFQVRDYEWNDIKGLPAKVDERVADAPSEDTSVDSAKLEAIKELIEAYRIDYERVEALFKVGVEGGEPATRAQAQVRLALARADLAELEKDSTQCGEQLDIAYKAAEEAVEALEATYTVGRTTLEELSAARAERARIKMRRADIRNDVVKEVEPIESKHSRAGQPEQMRVKVVDSAGKPLEGAWVFRNLTFNDAEAKRSRIKNETYYTDKNGETIIKFEGEPINLNMWVKKESHVPLVTSWKDVATKGSEPIPASFEFRMTRGTKIGGIVTDVAGIPIAGAKVEVEDSSLYRDSAEAYRHSTDPPKDPPKVVQRAGRSNWLAYGEAGLLTDAEGKWSLDNVPTDDELLVNKDKWTEGQTPLRLRFSHPDYETIDGIENHAKVYNPTLESLRDGSARAEMKWVNKHAPERVNAVLLEQGQQYKNADFSGRHFKGQQLMVWSGDMLAGANLKGSTWEEMMIPGVGRMLYEADLSDARIINAQLIGRESGMQKTKFTRATLETADISGGASGLQKALFTEATITNSTLRGDGASFQLADFQNAKLHSSKLSGSGPAFSKSNFDGARLFRTTISCNSRTAFQGVKLNDTEFVECDLISIDAEALRSCEFDTVTPPRYDAKTKLPKGFDPLAAGWKLIE